MTGMTGLVPGYTSMLAGIIAGAFLVYVLFGIVLYLLMCTAFFLLFRKAGVKYPWLAYIPIAQLWPYFQTIKKNTWNVLWFLLPMVAGILGTDFQSALGGFLVVVTSVVIAVLGILWQVRFLKAFNMSPWLLLLLIGFVIPILGFLFELAYFGILLYMGFSSNVHYNPNFDERSGPGTFNDSSGPFYN